MQCGTRVEYRLPFLYRRLGRLQTYWQVGGGYCGSTYAGGCISVVVIIALFIIYAMCSFFVQLAAFCFSKDDGYMALHKNLMRIQFYFVKIDIEVE